MSRLRKHLKSKSESSKKIPNEKVPPKGSRLDKSKTILRRKSPPVKVEEESENTSTISSNIIKRKVAKGSDETVPPDETNQSLASSESEMVQSTEINTSAEDNSDASVTTEVKQTEVSKAKSLERKVEAPKTTERPKELAHLGKAVIAPPTDYAERMAKKNQKNKAVVPNFQDPVQKDDRSDRKRGHSDKKEKDPFNKDKDKGNKNQGRRNRRMKQRDWNNNLSSDDGFSSYRRRKSRYSGTKRSSPKAKAIKRRVMVDNNISVANLAHGMSVKSSEVIKKLLTLGQIVTINELIDFETASILAEEFDFEIIDSSFQENEYLIESAREVEEEGEPRSPVVTIMGHVDHGKTTLLDTIRNANVAAGEAGGITQHTSAYQVEHDGKTITFIDTPGHEAFTAMRARGAQVTDIVILVVAADDGPMPQTIEALNHAKASGVQIMVAVNKCDMAGANPQKVRQELMQHELIPEEYGGETIFVDISALKGEGIDDLLENISLISEMGEYKAPTNRHAEGFVLEAKLEKGRGAVATLLIKKGTLKQGDSLVLGNVWGRVRAMQNFKGKKIKSAGPSTPVELIGLQDVPLAGDDFVVVKNDKDAKTLVDHRIENDKKNNQTANKKVTLEDLLKMQNEEETVKLNLILKSDVGGTLEAMKVSIDKIDIPGTEVNVLHSAIGAINEGDISLANTYNGIVIGFNVRPDAKARRQINVTNVEVRSYSVIYEALDDIEQGLKGLLAPELKEQWQGLAEIRETFGVPKVGTVAGCMVLEGKIIRNHSIRLLREGKIIWEGKLASLKRFKDDAREVEKGYECGMNLDGFNDIKVGDQLETFTMEEVAVV
jgi:translation initiation factor IF-2